MHKQCFMLSAMELSKYLEAERGRQAKVAARAGIGTSFLSQLANGVRGVPAERCPAIEAATDGAVRRWDLRPDDWHRIWPELIGSPGAPEVPEPAAQEAA